MQVNVAISLFVLLFYLPITFIFKFIPDFHLNGTEELTIICQNPKSIDNKMVEEKNTTYQCKLQIVTISEFWRKLVKSKPNEYLPEEDNDISRTNFLEVKYKIKKQEDSQFLGLCFFSNCWQILITIVAMKVTDLHRFIL